MDWSKNIWVLEDKAYAPKRKVNNKGSKWYPHIIGSFYSHKNKRSVEYESLNERMFYSLLELEQDVIRYYVQPIRVPMVTENKTWFHIPDVLIFRQGSLPMLCQIKESPSENMTPKVQQCNFECESIAQMNNWKYSVIYPKTLPNPLPRNINFLGGYLRTRSYYSNWYDQVIYRLRCIGPCTVEQLSLSFMDSVDPLLIKPLIFHLIASGFFQVDVTQTIDSSIIVSINNEMKPTMPLSKGNLKND